MTWSAKHRTPMRRKTGEPKLRALRARPAYKYGFHSNPVTATYRHPSLDGGSVPNATPVVSLFAGCGGMDLGFLGGFQFLGRTYEALPFEILDAIDIDEKSIQTYRLNIGSHGRVGDLTKIAPAELPPCRVLIGGFPCQDFSSSGPKVGLAGARGQLYQVLVDYMKAHQPEVVVAENVPHLQRLNNGEYLKTILADFEACGYDFDVWELYGPEYGLPQSRRRLFLVGVRFDVIGRPACPSPTHRHVYVSVDEALKDLETITDETVPNQSQYFVATKATAGGGQGDHTNRRGEPAYCIRANAKARIQFHYSLERRLTVRECARLQSFPDEFVFPFFAMNAMTQIGNAVPPLLGHHVAKAIADFLTGEVKTTASARLIKRRKAEQIDLFSAIGADS
ncbi:MAG: DNA (cytosine-5-)-methyltransferase [Candidatus Eisenbacteria bacterium]|nr:DNA (cytosine-5-)-methyltransferase [Candidatus Eisenbacteria bacterium]